MKLRIASRALQEMQQHAQEDYPNECCGFFYGVEQDDIRQVHQVRRVENAKEGDQRRRFQIRPVDYQRAEKYALDHDLDLLGVYHSHPDHPAEPSEHDRKVAMPWFSYLIISVQEGKAVAIRSWRLDAERQFEEEALDKNKFNTKQKT